MVYYKKLGLVSNQKVVMATYTSTPTLHKLMMTNQNYNICYKLIITLEYLCIDTEMKKKQIYYICYPFK